MSNQKSYKPAITNADAVVLETLNRMLEIVEQLKVFDESEQHIKGMADLQTQSLAKWEQALRKFNTTN